jgi:murein DD-endopeptidase MepM/ murein hydrolase activator NlpD
MHLRRGSVSVAAGDELIVGTALGECGNSGNSTQPHVHVQVMDNSDATVAAGLPLAFRDYREWVRGTAVARPTGAPAERAIVESTLVA